MNAGQYSGVRDTASAVAASQSRSWLRYLRTTAGPSLAMARTIQMPTTHGTMM
jgi:hypothetical protein